MSPHLFAFRRLFLVADLHFGDESGSSSPRFMNCSFGRGSSFWELHIPAVRRFLLPRGLEVLLPVMSERSRCVSLVQSVEKLPYHQQSISGSCRILSTKIHTILKYSFKLDICLTSFDASFIFDFVADRGKRKEMWVCNSTFGTDYGIQEI